MHWLSLAPDKLLNQPHYQGLAKSPPLHYSSLAKGLVQETKRPTLHYHRLDRGQMANAPKQTDPCAIVVPSVMSLSSSDHNDVVGFAYSRHLSFAICMVSSIMGARVSASC